MGTSLMQLRSLDHYIAKNRFSLKLSQLILFTKQILSACTYLQNQGIVHRDLKPANIFVKDGSIKIGDFGLARVIKQDETNSATIKSFVTFAGTLHFMAPEILMHNKYSPNCDVWSVGITLYLMFTGQLPYDIKPKDKSQKLLLEKITNNKIGLEHKNFSSIPNIAKLIESMLEFNETKRPKMSTLQEFYSKILQIE